MNITLPPPNDDITFTLTYKRVKNINLRVDGSIKVSAPHGVPQAYIVDFVAKNAPRLRRTLQNAAPRAALHHGLSFTLFGAPYVLKIGEGERSGDGVIAINSPDVGAFAAQVKKLALPRFAALCQKYLPLFARHCTAPPTIKMRRMKTQWANCNVSDNAVDNVSGTRANTLTFSYNLVFAPIEAIEYVVVHELCHFIHQNHSAAFYAEVAKVLPDWKARRQLLKETKFLLD